MQETGVIHTYNLKSFGDDIPISEKKNEKNSSVTIKHSLHGGLLNPTEWSEAKLSQSR